MLQGLPPPILKSQTVLKNMCESLKTGTPEQLFSKKILFQFTDPSFLKENTGLPVNFLSTNSNISCLNGVLNNSLTFPYFLFTENKPLNLNINGLSDINLVNSLFDKKICIYTFSGAPNQDLCDKEKQESEASSILTYTYNMESTYIGQSRDINSRLRFHYFTSISSNINKKTGLLYSYEPASPPRLVAQQPAENPNKIFSLAGAPTAQPNLKFDNKKTRGLKNMRFNINLSLPNFIDLFLEENNFISGRRAHRI